VFVASFVTSERVLRRCTKERIGGEAAKKESSAHLLKSRCGSAIWRLA